LGPAGPIFEPCHITEFPVSYNLPSQDGNARSFPAYRWIISVFD
jgi:hypothetical protein